MNYTKEFKYEQKSDIPAELQQYCISVLAFTPIQQWLLQRNINSICKKLKVNGNNNIAILSQFKAYAEIYSNDKDTLQQITETLINKKFSVKQWIKETVYSIEKKQIK